MTGLRLHHVVDLRLHRCRLLRMGRINGSFGVPRRYSGDGFTLPSPLVTMMCPDGTVGSPSVDAGKAPLIPAGLDRRVPGADLNRRSTDSICQIHRDGTCRNRRAEVEDPRAGKKQQHCAVDEYRQEEED